VLGSVAGVGASFAAVFKGHNLGVAGDDDAKYWTFGVAAVSAVSAVTSGAAALTASGAAAAAHGTTSIVGATLFGIGPAGWAILTVGLVVAGLWLSYKAGEATDDPLESWLKQCLAGRAAEKLDADAEKSAYNALFSLPLEVEISSHGSSGRLSTQVRMRAPALAAESELVYELRLTDKAGAVHTVADRVRLQGGKPAARIPAALRPDTLRPITVTEASRTGAETTMLRLLVDSQVVVPGQRDPASGEIARQALHSLRELALTVKYLPLASSEPDWVLPGGEGKVETLRPQ